LHTKDKIIYKWPSKDAQEDLSKGKIQNKDEIEDFEIP